ncbi:MAG: DMT family transporter [Clostridia bacterium]|nr:DMT family transporter [Clostridia bacterium]
MKYSKLKAATILAIVAAALYAINIPLSKLLLQTISATMMAAFLYLGAGLGMGVWQCLQTLTRHREAAPSLTRKELPYTVAMVLLDIAAPILLMAGIAQTNPAHVSLLNNFEIVATSLIALLLFREVISKRLWFAIGLITAASLLLSLEGREGMIFNAGSLLALGACVCWGIENNCTRKLSSKSSTQIVIVKGIGSGLGSLIVALSLGDHLPDWWMVLAISALGFVSYGLSIKCYVMAQKELGAAKTSAYYSIAPFLGVFFSLLLLQELPALLFYFALFLMIAATVLVVKDTISLQHEHAHIHIHTHPHRHGNLLHTHPHEHSHTHTHVHTGDETAHSHSHSDDAFSEHTHSHD